jgi:hypothetical protein
MVMFCCGASHDATRRDGAQVFTATVVPHAVKPEQRHFAFGIICFSFAFLSLVGSKLR